MASKEELRNRLIEKLKELFQLDRPELDFGLYRIMHAKDKEVIDYLENGLPATLQEAVGDIEEGQIEERRREYEEELQRVKDLADQFEIDNPEEAESVQKAKQRLEEAKERADADERVYDHLYRFFSRYYEKGDFITRRYRVRETDTQAAPYAIPYDGEEVKLHWANADQYYIKTAEHLRNFRFDLRDAVEETSDGDAPDLGLAGDEALPVHFRVVDGEEGEHDNVKDADNKVRKLKPYTPDLLDVTDDGELVVNYEVVFQKSQGEYIYDDEMEEHLEDKYGTSVGKSDKESLAVAETVFEHLGEVEGLDSGYHDLLRYVPPPNNKSTPPLLARYYEQFADKHEMDYFIHKDLGSFLRRELDFYIKNEVMRLDDIERADAPRVESYLDKVKALRRAAHDIIDFLAQLENFQKELWLKKKFVVETNYCMTLDKVPKELYPEVAANEEQRRKWVELFGIDQIGDDLLISEYTEPLTVEFLEENQNLVLDTSHFSKAFKNKLIAHFDSVSRQLEGVAVNSENFHGLSLIRERYRSSIDAVYTDPPYNKDNGTDFAYKDSFKHSSWISMMRDRLKLSNSLLKENSSQFLSIDEHEFNNLYFIGDHLDSFEETKVVPAITNLKGNQDTSGFASCHEYIVAMAKSGLTELGRLPIPEEEIRDEWSQDEYGLYKKADGLRATGKNAPRSKRPNLWYPIFVDRENKIVYTSEDNQPIDSSHEEIWPVNEDGKELSWYWEKDKVNRDRHDLIITEGRKGQTRIYKKQRPGIGDIPTKKPKSFLYSPKYSSTHGGNLAEDMFGKRMSSFTPKSIHLIKDIIHLLTDNSDGIVLDYFAGTGTTGHAVIDLNRDSDKKREYVLVEMGQYFESTLLPRLLKAAYSRNWNDGNPEDRNSGTSHFFKYVRLESYEDTLNNLELDVDADRKAVLDENDDLRRDYLLHYMLDVETETSSSLLNIDEFKDPRTYHLSVKKPGSDASVETNVDLLETFNYLLGLRVEQINMPETFTAEFHRPEDPELPEDERTRLEIDGEMEPDEDGDWWFRTVTGWVPSDPMNPDDSDQERILVIWRTLTDDREQDNAMLNAYVEGQRDDLLDADRVYVNGSNNLASLRREDEDWEVHLLEKEFMERMWDVQDV